ncbi:MAG: hypothetical protein ACREF1_07170 [Acetobacteraceae bacterium]
MQQAGAFGWIGLLAMLTACAGTTPPLVPGPFDASYAGSTRLVGFSSPDWHCYWEAPSITILDSRFTAELDGARMTVPVGPDGRFDAYGTRPVYSETKYETPVHVSGRVAGGVLTATVHQPRCTFRLDFARR